MTKPHLRQCASCARHVRVSESACPFCGAAIDASLAASAAPLPPAVRLSRAALFALGAGTISLTTACGGIAVEGSPRGGDSGVAADGGGQTDDGYDGGNIAVPYGIAPPPVDSGVDREDSAAPTDAGGDADAPDAHEIIAPPYGGPPGH